MLLRLIREADQKFEQARREGQDIERQVTALGEILDSVTTQLKDVRRAIKSHNSMVSTELHSVVSRMREVGNNPTPPEVHALADSVSKAATVLDEGTNHIVGHDAH